MKRVKDYLNELNRNELISAFFEYAENDLDAILGIKDLPCDEAEYQKCQTMDQLIQKLADMDITEVENGNTYIILAYPSYSKQAESEGVPTHTLICKEKYCLEEKSFSCEECSEEYITSPQSEMIGFYVSDTLYTQEHIYETIAQVLYNATCYGLNQEYLEYEYQDYIPGNIWSAWYKLEDFYVDVLETKRLDDAGLLSMSEEAEETSGDIKQLMLYADIFLAQQKFNSYCKEREGERLQKSLLPQPS